VVIEPFSAAGLIVLAIFLLGMVLIALEAVIHMDKFKPALLMTSGLIVIAVTYFLFGHPEGIERFAEAQSEIKKELFALIAFMAFMWMIVEVLNERNVFNALNDRLLGMGLGPKGMFWATGGLSALLSPFLNNITTAMIFGKSITSLTDHTRYKHVALCNIILGSNSGVWFIGTSTSLMVVLAGKISIGGLLLLAPAAFLGWVMSAAVLHAMYLRDIDREQVFRETDVCNIIKPGGIGLTVVSFIAVVCAVLMNMVLKIDIEFALGIGLSIVALYGWYLKKMEQVHIPFNAQLQKVEWNTLLFFIGIITAVACLNHVGWLSYITWLFENANPILVNMALGGLSGILDNVPVEAAALMSNPQLGYDQWALNALMVGIGGSLTVIGSAAGIMAMSLEKTYTFAAHLKFLPAILVNFFGSLGLWYLFFVEFGFGG
jgi:Na+/H+ antiporter NhaD/arsenite permease-like protein